MSRDEERRRLEVENELLSLEIEALRGAAPDLETPVTAERLAELEEAERDLHRVLRRLGRGPAGWLMRRWRGYRRLARRHLDDD